MMNGDQLLRMGSAVRIKKGRTVIVRFAGLDAGVKANFPTAAEARGAAERIHRQLLGLRSDDAAYNEAIEHWYDLIKFVEENS